MDSGAFIALIRAKDRQHQRFGEHFEALFAQRVRLLISDAVISETATRLRYDVGLEACGIPATITLGRSL